MLLDVKRGDIGSTMAAYAQAYLGEGSPLAADAVTVSPFLGFGSLRPGARRGRANGRGVFVLALTSNPEGPQVQRSVAPDGRTVAQTIVDVAAARNAGVCPLRRCRSRRRRHDRPKRTSTCPRFNGPILAPGFGAQGARVGRSDKRLFGPDMRNVLPTSSRDVLRHGPTSRRWSAACRGFRRASEAPARHHFGVWRAHLRETCAGRVQRHRLPRWSPASSARPSVCDDGLPVAVNRPSEGVGLLPPAAPDMTAEDLLTGSRCTQAIAVSVRRGHRSEKNPHTTEEIVALPQLTEEQRAAALEKAAAARRARAELKERLKRGGTTLTDVLEVRPRATRSWAR